MADTDAFRVRTDPAPAAGGHDDWIPIDSMSPPIFRPLSDDGSGVASQSGFVLEGSAEGGGADDFWL